MPFLNRWLIQGILTTRTPLRIGDGGIITARERGNCEYLVKRKRGLKVDEPVEISTVAVDAAGRAYIPGTTLKGNLLAWARACQLPDVLVETFFGRGPLTEAEQFARPTRDAEAIAGKIQFWNLQAVEAQSHDFTFAPPGWHERRLTAVTASVAINRRTRTTSDKKLFHQEYVPPGVEFVLTLGGNDDSDEVEATRNDQGLLELLALLEGFNRDNGVTLGAETDGLGDGWGRLTWNLKTIKRLDHEGVRRWLKAGGHGIGYEILEELTQPQQSALKAEAESNSVKQAQKARPRNHVSLKVEMNCLESFIINDVSRTKHPDQPKDDDVSDAGQDKSPNHAPLRDINGYPLLPRRSVKGAVRSQAERILRTMGGDRAACYPNDPRRSCKPITKLQQAKNLCLACQVFGASGWKSPFKCTPFIAAAETVSTRQEFVAIDRFTGGSAHQKKFNTETFNRPLLQGEFGLDLKSLSRIGAGKWAIGLLALTMRDLMEGDIRIGFGAAKGYGEIAVSIRNINLSSLKTIIEVYGTELQEEDISTLNLSASLDELMRSTAGKALKKSVVELKTTVDEVNAI